MQPTKKDIKVANKIIKIMVEAGLTPDQMLEVIELARKKFEVLKSKD